MAGIGDSSANAFPLLLLPGSSETHLVTKGAFQEMDVISLLTPHVKIAIRASLDSIPQSIRNAYRTSWYGRGGVGFVDLLADVIQGEGDEDTTRIVSASPRAAADLTNRGYCKTYQVSQNTTARYWKGRGICPSRSCNSAVERPDSDTLPPYPDGEGNFS